MEAMGLPCASAAAQSGISNSGYRSLLEHTPAGGAAGGRQLWRCWHGDFLCGAPPLHGQSATCTAISGSPASVDAGLAPQAPRTPRGSACAFSCPAACRQPSHAGQDAGPARGHMHPAPHRCRISAVCRVPCCTASRAASRRAKSCWAWCLGWSCRTGSRLSPACAACQRRPAGRAPCGRCTWRRGDGCTRVAGKACQSIHPCPAVSPAVPPAASPQLPSAALGSMPP